MQKNKVINNLVSMEQENRENHSRDEGVRHSEIVLDEGINWDELVAEDCNRQIKQALEELISTILNKR